MAKKKLNLILEGLSEDHIREKHCIVPISLGQGYHEGEQLEESMKLLAKHFTKITIVIADSLQRHTRKITAGDSLNMDDLETRLEGQSLCWKNKLKNVIFEEAKFFQKTVFNIQTWDVWRKKKSFENMHQKVTKGCYEGDQLSNFGRAVEESVAAYLNPRAKAFAKDKKNTEKKNPFVGKEAEELSRAYVLEESAITLMWREEDCFNYHAYPKKNTPALFAVTEGNDFTCFKPLKNLTILSLSQLTQNVEGYKNGLTSTNFPIKKSSSPPSIQGLGSIAFFTQHTFQSPPLMPDQISLEGLNPSSEFVEYTMNLFRMNLQINLQLICQNPYMKGVDIRALLRPIILEMLGEQSNPTVQEENRHSPFDLSS